MVRVINIDTKTRTIRIENEDPEIKTWRTTESGTHFPIREGETTKGALDKFVEKKRPEAKKDENQELYDRIGEYAKSHKLPLDEQEHLVALRKMLKEDKNSTEHVKRNFEKWFDSKKEPEKAISTESDSPLVSAVAKALGTTPEDAEVEINGAVRHIKDLIKAKDLRNGDVEETLQGLGIEPDYAEEFMQWVTAPSKKKNQTQKSETTGWPESPKFEKLTEQHMPKQGEADNELGEMLRSINQVVYRYYNDGDMWNKGYGKETVNKAIKHLTELSKNKETPRHIARGLDNGLYELKKYGIKDKDRYETALKILLQTVEFADQSDIDALSKMP